MGEEAIAAGTVLDDKFRILRLLGRGGMGEVYAVRHELTQHERALKLLHSEWREHDEVVRRFLREASAAGRIDHPHICETYDAGYLSTGEPYVLMELLEGRSLEDWLSEEHTLPVAVAADLVAQACRGIQAAHDAGIVHRDLKPENLLVVEKNGEPFVKLLDFGISKFEDALNTSRATQAGALMGTPYYMSPEQFADGHDVDGRADVYSLGVILYECVTGRPPFVVDTLAQLAKKVMLDEPEPPSTLQSALPESVDGVVMRALQKDPEGRYPTASAMAQDLEQLTRKFGVTFPQGGRAWEPSDAPAVGPDTLVEQPAISLERPSAASELAGDTIVDPPVSLAPPTLASVEPEHAPSKVGFVIGGLLIAGVTSMGVVWLSSPGTPATPTTDAPSASVPAAPASAATVDGEPKPTATTASAPVDASPPPAASSAPSVSIPTPPRPQPVVPAPTKKPEHATADEFPD